MSTPLAGQVPEAGFSPEGVLYGVGTACCEVGVQRTVLPCCWQQCWWQQHMQYARQQRVRASDIAVALELEGGVCWGNDRRVFLQMSVSVSAAPLDGWIVGLGALCSCCRGMYVRYLKCG